MSCDPYAFSIGQKHSENITYICTRLQGLTKQIQCVIDGMAPEILICRATLTIDEDARDRRGYTLDMVVKVLRRIQ